VHGAYVSDDEVQQIVSFLAAQRKPEYNLDITAPRDDDSIDDVQAAGGRDDNRFDDLYDQAVRIVAETRQASASFLQRRLNIGFNRAARLIEQLEREGVVGPQKGQKPREVLIGPI
jgi:S-DNA-T family DNA segregation ATPase FtsK/SpoIIIE